MEEVVKQSQLPPGSPVLADKGYASAANEALLEVMGLKVGFNVKLIVMRP